MPLPAVDPFGPPTDRRADEELPPQVSAVDAPVEAVAIVGSAENAAMPSVPSNRKVSNEFTL